MKNIILIVVFVLFGCSEHNPNRQTKQPESSIHKISYKGSGLIYVADKIIEECFVMYYSNGNGITQLSCKSLAKRPEWKSIITWVNTD